jgi:cytosine-specific methyltransferase
MQGGNQEPKILEEQIPCKLDKMPNGHLDSLDNAEICDINTPTASTVTSRYYKGVGSHKDNMCIVAMRGRNPDNPSDRTVGNPTEQRLEVNMQGTSNCLTSVQKDNLVIESQVLTPKRTEYGKQIRKAYESGRIQESRHNMTELEPRKDDISNTLTTVQKDNLLLENNIQKVGQISSNGSQCGTVISDNGISANLVAGTHGYANSHIATQYRIRKLTPRECGRLMGVSDEDIDKMSAVNSNTQLYKQFGNSIVADVMCAMFKNLNIKQGDSNEALQTN